jgi:hypothetical protein
MRSSCGWRSVCGAGFRNAMASRDSSLGPNSLPRNRTPSGHGDSRGRAMRRRPSLMRWAHGAAAMGAPPGTRAWARFLISVTVAASSPERLTAKPLPADVTLAFTPFGMSGQ